MILNMTGGSKDKNLLPENIKEGVEIDGVVGTYSDNFEQGFFVDGAFLSSGSVPSVYTLKSRLKGVFIKGTDCAGAMLAFFPTTDYQNYTFFTMNPDDMTDMRDKTCTVDGAVYTYAWWLRYGSSSISVRFSYDTSTNTLTISKLDDTNGRAWMTGII